MATKRLTGSPGKTIEIRAKVKRQGALKNLDQNHIEAEFPHERLPATGSTIYIHDRFMLQSTEEAENAFVDIAIYFTVQQRLGDDLVRAAVARIAKGSLANLEHAYAQGIRPVIGHAQNDITSVKALISHPMASGDGDEHFIQEISCTHNERVLVSGQWGRGMARDPYLAFEFSGGGKGDLVSLSWSDNQGNSDVAETTIK